MVFVVIIKVLSAEGFHSSGYIYIYILFVLAALFVYSFIV